MNDKLAISVQELTKTYQLYEHPSDRLKEAFSPLKKSFHRDFHALSKVTFSIQRGETVGIIGRNGAGKSTLLKIITGVLSATSGEVETSGKIASLLELGAGFNPEMSGLDNVYLNGTIMGFSQAEMDERISGILEFADIGQFIHQPVKTYSSGMFARLAFSVAIAVEPEILIVDEALSVGDMAFQMKCYRKFEDLQAKNKTILFVTHSLDSIIRYCSRSIVIDNGTLIVDTTPKEGVDVFKQILAKTYTAPSIDSNITTDIGEEENTAQRPLMKNLMPINVDALIYGNGNADIIDICIFNDKGEPSTGLHYQSFSTIHMKVKFTTTVPNPIFAFTFKDSKGLEITGTNTMVKNKDTGVYKNGDIASIKFTQKMNLQTGTYALSLGCVSLGEGGIEVHSRYYDIVYFDIIGSEQMVGFFDLGSTIAITRTSHDS